jgi:Flp pilus assembly protein TadG
MRGAALQMMHPVRRRARGQSIVELAMILPVALFLLLGAVDYAQVLSAEQRLENAAHVATLRLLTRPGLSSPARLIPFIQAESGLSPVSAGATYSVSGEGADQVVVTATYDYPLLLPGLQNLRIGALGNGKFHITVSAAGVAVTSPPTVTDPLAGGGVITVAPPSDGTVPAGLTLTCTLYKLGVRKSSGVCSSGSPFHWTNPSPATSPSTNSYTATVMQVNGITSAPSTPVSGP